MPRVSHYAHVNRPIQPYLLWLYIYVDDLRVRREPPSEVEHPVESRAHHQDHVRPLHQRAARRAEVQRVVVRDEAPTHRRWQERHTQRIHQPRQLLHRLGPAHALAHDHRRTLRVQQQIGGARYLVWVALRRRGCVVAARPIHRFLIHHLLKHVRRQIQIHRPRPARLRLAERHRHVLRDARRAVHLHRHLGNRAEHRHVVRLLERAGVSAMLRPGAADDEQRHTVVERDVRPRNPVRHARPRRQHRHSDLVANVAVGRRRERSRLLVPYPDGTHPEARAVPHHLHYRPSRQPEQRSDALIGDRLRNQRAAFYLCHADLL